MRHIWTAGALCLWAAIACGNDDSAEPEGGAGKAAGSAGQGGGSGPGGEGGQVGAGAEPSAGEGGDVASSGGSGGTAGSNGAGSGTAGTGGDPGEPGSLLPSFASGTRLEARELRYDDMPPVLLGFHDTALEVDCAFRIASDGNRRCLPSFSVRSPSISPQFFLDEDCTEPVAIADPNCVEARDSYAERTEPGTGCTPSLVHAYRATLLEDGASLFSNASGDCLAEGETNSVYRYFSLEELAPEEFVATELQLIPTPTRLSVQRFVADDGSFETVSLADPEVETDCRVFEGGEALSICVPAPEWSGREYRAADDACAVPLSLAGCREPHYIVDLGEGEDALVFFEAGAEHTGTVYGGIETCEVVEREGRYFGIGQAVPVSAFAQVTSHFAGTGRLRHLVYSDALGTELVAGMDVGGSIQSSSGLFDAEFDSTCTLRRYTDLELYCMPDSITMESINNLYYTDADCTEQVAVCGDNGCPHDVAMMQATPESGLCAPPPEFESMLILGEAIELDELYIFYAGREPGMQCDGPFSTDGYGVIREITGQTGVGDFVRVTATGQ